MEIYPLTISQVNWPMFLSIAKHHLGRGITRHIDDAHQDVKCPMAFLSSLKNILDLKFKDFEIPSFDGVSQHLYFGFLIADCPTLVLSTLIWNFNIYGNDKITIASGTLLDWEKYYRTKHEFLEIIELKKRLLDIFAQMGLKRLFE